MIIKYIYETSHGEYNIKKRQKKARKLANELAREAKDAALAAALAMECLSSTTFQDILKNDELIIKEHGEFVGLSAEGHRVLKTEICGMFEKIVNGLQLIDIVFEKEQLINNMEAIIELMATRHHIVNGVNVYRELKRLIFKDPVYPEDRTIEVDAAALMDKTTTIESNLELLDWLFDKLNECKNNEPNEAILMAKKENWCN